MKVRMKVSVSGSRNGKDWPPIGGTIDLPDAEAQSYITSGLAESTAKSTEAAVPDSGDAETATIDTKPKPRKRAAKSSTGLSKATVEGDGE